MAANPGSKLAFIGLGQMGMPMATNLAQAGYEVAGYDVSSAARGAFAQATGGAVVDTIAAAAEGTATAITMLPTSAIVRSVLVDGGLLEALPNGTPLIDMSSSEPLVTRELAEVAAAHGVRLIDAPVSGGVVGAKGGTLTIMVGADDEQFNEAAPLFDVLGGKVVHAGGVGAGHALKALNNLLSGTSLLVTSEAVRIGERFGLDPQVMIEAINTSSGRSFSTELKFPRYVLPETYDSGFGLRLMAKDMGIAVRLGAELGVPAALGAASTGLWDRACEEMAPDADHTEIARWVTELGEAAA